MPYNYQRIREITFKSLKNGRIGKEDIDVIIQFYKDQEDYKYCNALKMAYMEYSRQPENYKEHWLYLAKHKN